MKNNAVFRHIFIIAAIILMFSATGGIQSLSQTRKQVTTQRNIANGKKRMAPLHNKTSGTGTTNRTKKVAAPSNKENDVLYIDFSESRLISASLPLSDGYSAGGLYTEEHIIATYRNSVIRDNKSVVIEYNINIEWPRPVNYRDLGDSYEYGFDLMKEVQDLIKMKLTTVGIVDDLTRYNLFEIADVPGIKSCIQARVGFLKDCPQVLKNTITISTSLSERGAIVKVQEKNVDINGKISLINQSAKFSNYGGLFSPLSDTLDSKPDGINEYVVNLGSKRIILGLPDTNDKSNGKLPYYQFATCLKKGNPHTLEIKEGDNDYTLELEEYSDSHELIRKFIIGLYGEEYYPCEYYDFNANEKWEFQLAPREY